VGGGVDREDIGAQAGGAAQSRRLNDCFAETLGLPTIWVPHSYAACSQHAPNEHVLAPIMREGLQIMAGMFWDLGEAPARRLTEKG
jgi:hypothetical protein